MAIFDSILGIVGTVLDRVIPDKNERARAKEQLNKLEQSGELKLLEGQMAVNREEAKHASVFVAGWRPSIGWACALIFISNFLIMPLVTAIALSNGADIAVLAQYNDMFDVAAVYPVLMGMLGLGGLRTYEKFKGVSRSSL